MQNGTLKGARRALVLPSALLQNSVATVSVYENAGLL